MVELQKIIDSLERTFQRRNIAHADRQAIVDAIKHLYNEEPSK